jgi:hypothetical protein
VERGTLSEDAFARWSENYVLFLHVTSDVEGEPHPKLLEQKGGRGFPTFMFLDADGEVLEVHDEARTVEEFGKTADRVQKFLELQRRAEAGDRPAKIELTLIQLERGKLSAAEARARLKDAGALSAAQQKRLDQAELSAMVQEELRTVTSELKTQVAAGKKFADWADAGRVPARDEDAAAFWSLILAYAEQEGQVERFEQALGLLREKFGSRPANKKWFEIKEKALQRLKQKKP